MPLQHRHLPYEIEQTACAMFAGKTGFTQPEMRELFRTEIRKAVPIEHVVGDSSKDRLGYLGVALERMSYNDKLTPQPFSTRAEALKYWLSLLPLWRQKQLLLEFCAKPTFPMSKGVPSAAQRDHLTALLHRYVIDEHVVEALQLLNSEYIQETWHKTVARSAADPAGAITAARALLESVCKHILAARGEAFDERAELPQLYNQVASALNVAPSQQTEQVFKQILGGCKSVVEGFGALRNRLGDAHGHGPARGEPSLRHATLAVNLAGSMALFLLQSWEASQGVSGVTEQPQVSTRDRSTGA